jgi:hypothetical protein
MSWDRSVKHQVGLDNVATSWLQTIVATAALVAAHIVAHARPGDDGLVFTSPGGGSCTPRTLGGASRSFRSPVGPSAESGVAAGDDGLAAIG